MTGCPVNGGFLPAVSADRLTSLAKMPWLRADGLRGTVSYSDGQFDDARYNLALVQTAAISGADVLNYASVIGFEKDRSGRLVAAHVTDEVSGASFRVDAKVFVNATGPFSDHVRQLAAPEEQPRLRPSKGIHILLPLPPALRLGSAPDSANGRRTVNFCHSMDESVARGHNRHRRQPRRGDAGESQRSRISAAAFESIHESIV